MSNFLKKQQLFALFIIHAKILMREPAVLFWGIIFPILMALGLGLAFTQKKEAIHNIAIVQNIKNNPQSTDNKFESFLQNRSKIIKSDKGNKSINQLTSKDEKLGNSIYNFHRDNWKDAIVQLKRGEISLIIEETDSGIKYHFDPVSPDAHLTYLSLSKIINNEKPIDDDDNETVEPLNLHGTRYIDFLIPGLIAMGILMSSVWGLGYGIIETRSKKLLRRMIATPMRKSYFLISLITVRTAMNFFEASLLFLFSYFVFGITIQGNISALFLVFIAGNIGFAGLSILVASRTANPEVGNGLISAVTTPMFVLSGVFFSYHNFPDWSIGFIKILPLTLLADGIRSIFIEGAGFAQVALPFFVLISMGIIFFAIGLKLFKWH